jgi:uncharacterized protein YndB with AHSA1/START domain
VLRIADNRELMWNSLVVGIAVAVLALWEMRTDPELVKHWPGAGHATCIGSAGRNLRSGNAVQRLLT